jgi:8-oxo-dGTP diphosphatase
MNHYCLTCGSKLIKKKIEEREREICPQCGWIKYDQLKVTAGVLIEDGKKILLVKRAIDPWKGYWYLPAGYVENDEHPKSAAERECFEETNLKIKAGNLVNVYFYDDDPRGNGLLILYAGTIEGGEIKPNQEATEIRYFGYDEIESQRIAGGSHNIAIQDWVSKKGKIG